MFQLASGMAASCLAFMARGSAADAASNRRCCWLSDAHRFLMVAIGAPSGVICLGGTHHGDSLTVERRHKLHVLLVDIPTEVREMPLSSPRRQVGDVDQAAASSD